MSSEQVASVACDISEIRLSSFLALSKRMHFPLSSVSKSFSQSVWFKSFSSPRFILPLFAVLGLIGIVNHAMWRDEMNTWLIVRDSDSLGEMLGYVNYQGHPALWALLVSFVRNLSTSPSIMQLLHWCLGVSAIALFWYGSRFTPTQKVLFTFGYLPFYEYFLISRPYVLGMLFLFLFCTLYPSRRKTYLGLAAALGLMANSHAFAAVISLAALVALVLEFIWDKEQRSHYLDHSNRYDWILSLIVLISLYYFAYTILHPPLDSGNVGGRGSWDFAFDLRHLLRVLGRLLGGYTLIIPNSERWFDLVIGNVIGVSIFSVIAIKLARFRTPCLFFVFANVALLSVYYFRYLGHGARHYGYIYLILIAALWMAQSHQPVNDPVNDPVNGIDVRRLRLGFRQISVEKIYSILLMLILILHLGGGLYRYALDLNVPFSAAKSAAEYIHNAGLDNEFIVASPDKNMASLAGYLDRQLYYPEIEGFGSFTIFQKGRRQSVDQDTILKQIRNLLPGTDSGRILLVLVAPLEENHRALTIEPIAQFEQSWHASERMYLYWVTSNMSAISGS